MKNEKVDVLVVGGGPAGLSAAESAAAKGVKTLVIEREDSIGDPVHTSGGTAVSTMKEFAVPEHLYHVVRRLRICAPAETAEFEFDESTLCVIDVRDSYRYLADQAKAVGAVVECGVTAQEIVWENGTAIMGCRVRTSNHAQGTIFAKVIIDASGYRATVSKSSGLHGGFSRFGVGAEYELVAPHCHQDEAVLIVGNRYAPSGYAWVFPWGEDRVRIGVGILHGDSKANPKTHLSTLLKDASRFGVNLSKYMITESHFGLIPSEGLPRRFVADHIMAVGDAAGQPSLVVGEGIRLSMVAGQLAGRVAAEAIAQGDVDAKALSRYEMAFRREYERELRIGFILNRKMSSWRDANWNKHVRFARAVPGPLFADILQSRFSVLKLLRWVVLRPRLWPRLSRYALEGAYRYIFE